MLLAAFAPYPNTTGLLNSATLAATAAAQNLSIPVPAGGRVGTQQVRIYNGAAVPAYINIGAVASIAAATVANSMPIAPGAVEVITINPNADTFSIILASGTGNVTITLGEGL